MSQLQDGTRQECDTVKATALAAKAGITYRQFDYWCRSGYVPGAYGTGSGINRSLTSDQVVYVLRLAKLVKAGFSVQTAAEVLQQADPEAMTLVLTKHVTVTLS